MATLYYCPNCKNMRRAVFARGLCKNCNKQLNIDVTLSEKEWQKYVRFAKNDLSRAQQISGKKE